VKRQTINAAGTIPPLGGGYSNALQISDFKRVVFVSGQVPMEADGTVPEGFAAQCRLAWRNVEAQLRAADMSMANVVKVTTYLGDRAYGKENRVVRREFLGDLCPALTTIVCDIFDAAWLLEVEVIAAA
jgi:enamine deaminase RidA (YjgF/YER057c/UK114 family)